MCSSRDWTKQLLYIRGWCDSPSLVHSVRVVGGLTSIEHSVTGAVQVVPNSSALIELYSDCGKLIDIKDEYTYPGTLTIGKVINTDSAANILNELYESPKLLEDLSQKCYTKFTQPGYEWSNISKQWSELFKSVIK